MNELVARVSRELRGSVPADDGDVRELADRLVGRAAPLATDVQRGRYVDQVLSEVVGLGPLQELLDDGAVTDVMVNPDGSVWIERWGTVQRVALTIDVERRLDLVQRALRHSGVTVDRARPIADARLADGSRLAVLLPPVVAAPAFAIRRFRGQVDLGSFGDGAVRAALDSIVTEQANVVVFGPTGSGKTTLVEAMLRCIGPTERVVVIEDTPELDVGGHSVGLHTRRANNEGVGEVSLRVLVRAALRLRPDRVVVGEVRGPEALDMVWALSGGHTGCLSTVHARTAAEALARLETFCLLGDADLPLHAVRSQVRSAIDVVIGVGRGTSGHRRIVSIDRVAEADASAGDLVAVWRAVR